MFVRTKQIAEISKRHPELGRLCLVVTRQGETDVMTLKAEAANPDTTLREAVKRPKHDFGCESEIALDFQSKPNQSLI